MFIIINITKMWFNTVCRATIQEMQNVINKVDPRKKVEISGFRLDGSGSSGTRSVQYSKSETFLSELMESICMFFFFNFILRVGSFLLYTPPSSFFLVTGD